MKACTNGRSRRLRRNRVAWRVLFSAVVCQLFCFSWTSAHAQQRADKSGALCHADGIHIGKHNPRLRERFTHDRHDLPQMFARRQLRHDPAVFPVYIDLRRHDAGQISRPSATTAAAVSSHEDSIPRIFKSEIPAGRFSVNAGCSQEDCHVLSLFDNISFRCNLDMARAAVDGGCAGAAPAILAPRHASSALRCFAASFPDSASASAARFPSP